MIVVIHGALSHGLLLLSLLKFLANGYGMHSEKHESSYKL